MNYTLTGSAGSKHEIAGDKTQKRLVDLPITSRFISDSKVLRARERMFLLRAPQSRRSEEIRTLRSQILMQYKQNFDLPVITTVLGFTPITTKATITANLAVAFAQTGMNTLLIDGSMRDSQLTKLLELEHSPGLAQFLSGQNHANNITQEFVDVKHLYVIASGLQPSNPQELLSNKTFSDLIALSRKEYDVILFNSPAFRSCSDAEILACHSDNCILLADKNHTKSKDIKYVTDYLHRSNIPLLGSAFCN